MRHFIESLLMFYIFACVIVFAVVVYFSCMAITCLASVITLGKNSVPPSKFHRVFMQEVKSII